MKVSKTILSFSIRFLSILLFCSLAVPAQNSSFTIQIASATSESEARAKVADLKAKGLEAYWVKAEVPGKGVRYRVRIGRYNNTGEAKSAAERTRSRGLIKEYIVTNYDTSSQPIESKPQPETPSRTTLPNRSDRADRTDRPNRPDRPNQSDQAKMERLLLAKGESLAKESLRAKANSSTNPPAAGKNREIANSSSKLPKNEEIKPPPVNSKSQSDLADLGGDMKESAANLEPKIATPPIADALADFSIGNDNWRVVKRSIETDKNLLSIYFVDSMTGWAGGDAGALFRTTDGGRSWKPLLCGAPANIFFMYFIDWNNGWMLGGVPGKVAARNEGGGDTILFITTNGGRSWTQKPLPNVLRLHFTDPKNGWAVGKDATLLKTTDGGEQWNQVEGIEKLTGLPVESSTYNFGFSDVFFLDKETGWVVGNFYGRARSNIGGLFVTSDGGKSWKRMPMTLQTQYSSGRFTPGVLHSVHYTDANTGTVTGEMYDGEGRFFFVLHTRDGGKIWEQFRTPSIATHRSQFLNLSNGWTAAAAPREGGAEAIVYDTTLMRTDNGGMSWQNDFVARGRRIRNVFFISPTKGWAVGDRGMILRYEDKAKED